VRQACAVVGAPAEDVGRSRVRRRDDGADRFRTARDRRRRKGRGWVPSGHRDRPGGLQRM